MKIINIVSHIMWHLMILQWMFDWKIILDFLNYFIPTFIIKSLLRLITNHIKMDNLISSVFTSYPIQSKFLYLITIYTSMSPRKELFLICKIYSNFKMVCKNCFPCIILYYNCIIRVIAHLPPKQISFAYFGTP